MSRRATRRLATPLAATLVVACEIGRDEEPPEPSSPPPPPWSRCAELVRSERDDCYEKEAVGNAAYTACLEILNGRQRASCLTLVAKQRLDGKPCREISDRQERERCLYDLARQLADVELCPRGTQGRDGCIHSIAVEEADAELCANVKSSKTRGRCVADVARKVQESGLCSGIEHVASRDQCFLGLHVVSVDDARAFCSKVEDDETRDRCYEQAARALFEPELCNALEGKDLVGTCRERLVTVGQACFRYQPAELRGRCRAIGARLVGDPGACNGLLNETERESCRKHASR